MIELLRTLLALYLFCSLVLSILFVVLDDHYTLKTFSDGFIVPVLVIFGVPFALLGWANEKYGWGIEL